MCQISPNQNVKNAMQTRKCGTQTATKKNDETESVNSPTGCSEKPVSAIKTKLAISKFSVFKVNRSVPRKPASFGRAGKPFEGLVQMHMKSPKEPSREPHNTTVTILVSLNASSPRRRA